MSAPDPYAAAPLNEQCGAVHPDFPLWSGCHRPIFHAPHALDDGTATRQLWLDTYTGAGPRTWSLPPEPGPEVIALRDSAGRIWTKLATSNGWLPDDGHTHWATWGRLLTEFGPLTDATPPL